MNPPAAHSGAGPAPAQAGSSVASDAGALPLVPEFDLRDASRFDVTATFPKLLAGLAERFGDRRVALQEKRYGIFQPITWRQYWQRARDFAHGLAALGVRNGEVVAVIGDNRPEWLITEVAAQCLGACVVGVYPTSVGDEVTHILTHGQVRVVVAEDQEQVDKIIGLRDRLEGVEHVVFYDPRGLELYEQPYLQEFAAIEALGRAYEKEHPGWLDERVDAGRAHDVAVICTTSGTTGSPKLAMLTHANLLFMGRSLMTMDPLDQRDRHMSVLPLAWIGEQMMAVACGLQAGFTVSFAEEANTVKADLREIGPTAMFGPPRIWEDMLSQVQVRVGDAGWVKRVSFASAYRAGERAAGYWTRGRRVPHARRVLLVVADVVALSRVREQLGLSRLKRCYTGGAPLGPDVFRFFHAIGVNLKQIYGQTEICGIAVAHRDGDLKANSVGLPSPGTEMRVTDNGEILLRSPAVFVAYFGDEESTGRALDDQGWLHTGDAGYLDDSGHLVVVDRAVDVLRTPGGITFSPAFVENKFKFSQYIEDAIVFGGPETSMITAMLTIDPDTVGTWAEKRRLNYTTHTDLAQKTEVYDLIAREIARANDDLPEGIQVRRFVLLHKRFDPDDDEITRTRKLRRHTIVRHYVDVVEALQGDADAVTTHATVTYQDGTTAERDVTLRIMSIDTFTPRPVHGRRLAKSGRP